jgi:hypothetical protein
VHPGISRAATMPVHGVVGSPLASPGLASPYGVGTFPPHVQQQYTPGVVTHTPTPPAAGVGAVPPQAAGQGQVPHDYSVHQQFYAPQDQYKPKQEGKGRFEENAGRLERGVTGMFKKIEKKFG